MFPTRRFVQALQPGRPWRWLLVASIFFLFTNGRLSLSFAAWLAPLFLLTYTRMAKQPLRGFVRSWLAMTLVNAAAWVGLAPFPPLQFAWIMALLAGLAMIPYALDRFARSTFPGFAGTFILPVAAVSVDLLHSLDSKTTWLSFGYSQDNIVLMQVVSVTGVSGVIFLLHWLAPVLLWAYEREFTWTRIKRGVACYALVMSLVLAFGGARLKSFAGAGRSVRVATVTPPDLLDHVTPVDLVNFQSAFQHKPLDPATREGLRAKLYSTYDDLFERTRREARAGANIVFWPEAAIIAFSAADRDNFVSRGRELARQEGIDLGMTVALIPEAADQLNDNQIVLIGPNGEVLDRYGKTRLIPGVEEPFTRPGSGQVMARFTPFGRVTAVICYDADDPRYLRKAGEAGGILVIPAGDWPDVAQLHARMARYRAVEEGLSLLRPANHGVSEAVDSKGRVLARMDHRSATDRVLAASLPLGEGRTFYATCGDVFGWTCVTLITMTIAFMVSRRKNVRQPVFTTSQLFATWPPAAGHDKA